jgi:hypothetical protein
MAWRQVRVTFIPKSRKYDYTEAKSYRPISLSSFLLKTMEKLIDRHIRGSVLKVYPLHQNQHSYQTGKSTETALHNVVTCIENATEYKGIALGAFLDMEGAFDRPSFDIITQATGRHGNEPIICRWICSMLESGNKITTLLKDTLRASMAKGCLQGGVLLNLLWSLVVDELLCELNDNDYYTVRYEDDIAILINRKFPQTVSEVLQTALGIVEQSMIG